MNDVNSLSHSSWNCKYHVVFAPKYRRKVFFGEKRREIGSILRTLCNWKGIKIIEAEVCADHIHMLIEIPPKIAVASFMGYLKGKSSCALPGFVDSKNEEKTERNAGYLVVSHSGGGMLRQGTRKGIRRTPANRGMRAHWVVKGLDISEDVCHGLCP